MQRHGERIHFNQTNIFDKNQQKGRAMATTEQKYKLNNLPAETTYTRFYMDFTGKKRKDGSENPFTGVTNVQQKLLAAIEAKAGRKLTYDYLEQHYGIWRGAIKPAFDDLEARGLIEKLGTSRYKITAAFKKNYLKIDDYLFQKLELVNLETGETVYKKPTWNASKIISLVTRGNRDKDKDGVFVSSQARIATALNIPKSTAGDNVRNLITDGIMTADPAEQEHDPKSHGLSSYKIAPEMLAVKHVRKAKPAKPKPRKTTAPAPARLPLPAQADDGAFRARIERHYYDLRQKAQDRAERALSEAIRDEEYGAIRKRLNELASKIPFVEIKEPAKAAQLTKELHELEAQADERLTALGINKADFKPRYSCTLCNDTGYYLDTGQQCKCLKQYIKTLYKA